MEVVAAMNGDPLPVVGWRKDAEGAGRFVLGVLRTKKGRSEVTPDVIGWLARWAFHWGRLELDRVK